MPEPVLPDLCFMVSSLPEPVLPDLCIMVSSLFGPPVVHWFGSKQCLLLGYSMMLVYMVKHASIAAVVYIQCWVCR